MSDLFASISVNRFSDVLRCVEDNVVSRYQSRHDYPMWPVHGESPVDAWEEAYHEPIRHAHYLATIQMVQVLRSLRTLA